MKKELFALIALLFIFSVVGSANAVIITFDDHPDVTQNRYGALGTYKGFEFHSDRSEDRLDWMDTVGSSWEHGAMSGDFTMINNYLGNGRINAIGNTDFTFDGLYARTWFSSNSYPLTILGYRDGSLVESLNYTLTADWTYFAGWGGVFIDELHLNIHPNVFLVDNLALNESPVPVPGALSILGFGLLGLAGISRRKN